VVVNNGVYAYDLGQEIGLQTGDKIIALNGQDYRKFDDLTNADVLLTDNSYYTVLRNGEEVKVTIPNDMLDRITEDNDRVDFIEPLFPFKVGAVQPQSNADMAGLKEGEKIVAINGQPVKYFQEFKEELGQHKNQRVALAIKQGEGIARTDSVLVSDDGTIGFAVDMDVDLAHQDFSFGESISIGTKKAFGVVWTNIRAFGKIFKGEVSASKSLSGPIGIAQIFGGEWIWSKFWAICGLLSMVLAFMNLLPIPALDGGHVVFLSYEIISGRKPSDKFLEGAQKVGMVLLLGLMAFAIFNDIWKAIF
jgi:regulator of sigma E protease